ncbi:MAG: polyphosphate kinase 1 [Cyanobacteria bacterium CRU_2_1]|nr:polyphosphate kinase 1 [Cyanobacteria bacterium RU_5_0]NJR63740.1 polyphosphate kinase 1 [Cyanobacteria bacterium CRU_2_1]
MPKLRRTSASASASISASAINLSDPQYYCNQELSWLEFNRRVLHEAIDPRTLLLERLKFMAIFSSNLDEFFMVRVAALKEQVEVGICQPSPDGMTPQEQLEAIGQRLRPMVAQQHRHFEQMLRPQLAANEIFILNYADLNQTQRLYFQDYFEQQIFPVLTPLAVDPGHPFPYISNLSLNLAVVVKDTETGEEHFARVKVPDVLPRFVPLPAFLSDPQMVWAGIPLEQIIAHNLEFLFPGMHILDYYLFRITRNADLEVEEEEAEDLLLAIEQELRKRRIGGVAVRMEIQASAPDFVHQTLMRELDLTENNIYEVEGLIGLKDLMFLTTLPLSKLKDPAWVPVIHPRLSSVNDLATKKLFSGLNEETIFSILRRQDLLLHHPYHSFATSVQLFIEQAASDPNVLAIKMTLYRTAGESPVIDALIAAAENGKQVAVLVELKARFDEENNINWARKLENAGVHVVYGLVGLKTHTKVVLVIRRESTDAASPKETRIRRYVHIGTGNYNHRTAHLYTDISLLSCRDDLGSDLIDLFNYLTGYSRQKSYRKLLVAPVNLRDRFLALIHREADHSRRGSHGRIVAKMNSLVDPQMIEALYKASQTGVNVDLIVRGICCLRPGIPGVSQNIRVISIVGRYLEHSRIFYFHNNGCEEVYIGSADWMPRNLDRRVEVITPIDDPDLSKDLQEALGIMLSDNRHAWELLPDGRYMQRKPAVNRFEQNSQKTFMEMATHNPGFDLSGLAGDEQTIAPQQPLYRATLRDSSLKHPSLR